MKLRAGYYYRIRNGDIAYVGYKSPSKNSSFPWHGEELRFGCQRCWSGQGSYLLFNESGNDLVERIKDVEIINEFLSTQSKLHGWELKHRGGIEP